MSNLTVKDAFEVDELIQHFYEEEMITSEEKENLFNLKDELFQESVLSISEIKEVIRNQAFGV